MTARNGAPSQIAYLAIWPRMPMFCHFSSFVIVARLMSMAEYILPQCVCVALPCPELRGSEIQVIHHSSHLVTFSVCQNDAIMISNRCLQCNAIRDWKRLLSSSVPHWRFYNQWLNGRFFLTQVCIIHALLTSGLGRFGMGSIWDLVPGWQNAQVH